MGKGSSEGSFGARLLVILLASGVVAIGLYPMRRDLKTLTRQAQDFVNKNLSKYSLKPDSTAGEDKNSRAMMIDSNEILEQPAPRKPKGVEDVSKSPAAKQVDRLTTDDRKELNDLVNSF